MTRDTLKNAGLLPVIAVMVFAVLLSIFSLSAIPAYAHAPEGSSEAPEIVLEPIRIYDLEGNLLEISIDELAEIEGNLCVCVATSFRVIHTAIDQLYGDDEIPTQGELTAVYRHPGEGHKNSFNHILTPDYAIYEKTGNPQKMTIDNWVYTFTRVDTGEIFETRVREGIIADGFFDLRYKVNGYKKGWHEDAPTEEEKAAFAAKWTETRDNFLTMQSWELYSGVEEPEEPAPVGGIIFSSALVLAIGVGFIYSSRYKRRK